MNRINLNLILISPLLICCGNQNKNSETYADSSAVGLTITEPTPIQEPENQDNDEKSLTGTELFKEIGEKPVLMINNEPQAIDNGIVEVKKADVSADCYFNYTLNAEIHNGTKKTVTGIILSYLTQIPGTDRYDETAKKRNKIKGEITISPYSSKNIHADIEIPEGYSYNGCYVSQVVFSDGTYETY